MDPDLGRAGVGWIESEVDELIGERIAESRDDAEWERFPAAVAQGVGGTAGGARYSSGTALDPLGNRLDSGG